MPDRNVNMDRHCSALRGKQARQCEAFRLWRVDAQPGSSSRARLEGLTVLLCPDLYHKRQLEKQTPILKIRQARTMNSKTAILLRIPVLILLPRTLLDNISCILGVRLNREPVIAKVTFAPECVDRCRIVAPNFFLLRIVADTHADVVVTAIAPDVER